MTRLPSALARGFDYTRSAAEIHDEFLEQSLELRDLFSPPALTSLSGLALVAHGAQQLETVRGVNEIAAGRGFDLLDGFIARVLDDESDVASLTDAAVDKVATGIIVKSAWQKHIVPKPILATIAAANICNGSLTFLTKYRHPSVPLRPSPSGKHSMALYTSSLLSHAYANALETEHPDRKLSATLRHLGTTAFVAGTAFAAAAACDYTARAK